MERSYGFPSNYFQNKHLLIPHLRDLYYKAYSEPVLRILISWPKLRQKNRNSRIYWACTKKSYFLTKSEAKNRNSCTHWACTKNSYFLNKSEAKKTSNSHIYWACTKKSYFLTKSEAKKQEFLHILSLY